MFSRGWRWGLWVNGSTEDVPSAPPHVLAISTVSKSMCSRCLPQKTKKLIHLPHRSENSSGCWGWWSGWIDGSTNDFVFGAKWGCWACRKIDFQLVPWCNWTLNPALAAQIRAEPCLRMIAICWRQSDDLTSHMVPNRPSTTRLTIVEIVPFAPTFHNKSICEHATPTVGFEPTTTRVSVGSKAAPVQWSSLLL